MNSLIKDRNSLPLVDGDQQAYTRINKPTGEQMTSSKHQVRTKHQLNVDREPIISNDPNAYREHGKLVWKKFPELDDFLRFHFGKGTPNFLIAGLLGIDDKSVSNRLQALKKQGQIKFKGKRNDLWVNKMQSVLDGRNVYRAKNGILTLNDSCNRSIVLEWKEGYPVLKDPNASIAVGPKPLAQIIADASGKDVLKPVEAEPVQAAEAEPTPEPNKPSSGETIKVVLLANRILQYAHHINDTDSGDDEHRQHAEALAGFASELSVFSSAMSKDQMLDVLRELETDKLADLLELALQG